MRFGPSAWKTYDAGIRKEWLLTNGLGGYAASTIIGANARRYHGLLVAALASSADRMLVLSQISEAVIRPNDIVNLISFCTRDICSNGEYQLASFESDPLPTWIYQIGDFHLQKQVSMVYGRNMTVVVYKIENGADETVLHLTPLVNFRNHHFLTYNQYVSFNTDFHAHDMEIKPYQSDDKVRIGCSDGILKQHDRCWFYNMDYPYERERGLNSTEDHYIPGHFEISLKPWEKKTVTLVACANEVLDTLNGEMLISREIARLKRLTKSIPEQNLFLKNLTIAADQFVITKRSNGNKTILAGYPWLNDWGRDTLISLPGLLLTTGRYQEAAEILENVASKVHDGLLIKTSSFDGEETEDTSADAPLWLFEAAYKYYRKVQDNNYLREKIMPALEQILANYKAGTKYGIHVDTDGLVVIQPYQIPLTWMDTKIGNWIVTPRSGKVIEINALWYNALKIMGFFSRRLGKESISWVKEASRVQETFIKTFWDPQRSQFLDGIDQDQPDKTVRPNQLLAMSLSFPVATGDMAKQALSAVFNTLFTPYGMRTLSPKDDQYKGICAGDPYQRDGTMHQGTIWPWLIGPFVDAWMRHHRQDPNLRTFLASLIDACEDHMQDACLGSISQVFDGNAPHLPRGCFSQAWSVAEVLRIYKEHYLPLTKNVIPGWKGH